MNQTVSTARVPANSFVKAITVIVGPPEFRRTVSPILKICSLIWFTDPAVCKDFEFEHARARLRSDSPTPTSIYFLSIRAAVFRRHHTSKIMPWPGRPGHRPGRGRSTWVEDTEFNWSPKEVANQPHSRTNFPPTSGSQLPWRDAGVGEIAHRIDDFSGSAKPADRL